MISINILIIFLLKKNKQAKSHQLREVLQITNLFVYEIQLKELALLPYILF